MKTGNSFLSVFCHITYCQISFQAGNKLSVTIKTEKKFSNIKSVSTFSSESLFRLRCFIDQEYILENFSGSYVNSTVSLEIGFKVTINNKSVPHSKRFSSSFAFYRKLLTIGHVSSFSRTKNYSTYVFLIMHTNKKTVTFLSVPVHRIYSSNFFYFLLASTSVR